MAKSPLGALLRGLTQNHAGWDDQIPDRSPEQVADELTTAMKNNSLWNVQDVVASGHNRVIHAQCRTRIFGFTDDVRVELSQIPGGGTQLHASSRSRVGKGDLGKNDRNLDQLASWLGRLRGG